MSDADASEVPTAEPAAPAPVRSVALGVLTAILLGIVSLTTALGAWQASTWSRQAAWYGDSSSDARDAAIIRGVAWQYDSRLDTESILEARRYALLQDEATASDDYLAAAYYETMVSNQLGRIVSDAGLQSSFQTWRKDGFPADENPTSNPLYLVQLRGDADAYTIASAVAGSFKDALEAKATVFTQASLINALALFLLGVAGINRLRTARFVCLAMGTFAFLVTLVMMATAY
ncbi:MAG: hypothetical protein KF727_05600 [Microbacteriaceae bacterium]|nr:hypothetical protein [Microbacteriaceae bacterium]